MSEINGNVYCIVDKNTNALFEVCATMKVAEDHCTQDCYETIRELGVEVAIVKRTIWIA